MQLDNEDRRFLEGHFAETRLEIAKVRDKINEHVLDDSQKLGAINAAIAKIEATPCPSVEKHIEEKHSGKTWVFLAAIIGGAAAFFTVLIEVLKLLFGGHK